MKTYNISKEITKQEVQILRIKMRNAAELYLKGSIVITAYSRLQQDCPN